MDFEKELSNFEDAYQKVKALEQVLKKEYAVSEVDEQSPFTDNIYQNIVIVFDDMIAEMIDKVYENLENINEYEIWINEKYKNELFNSSEYAYDFEIGELINGENLFVQYCYEFKIVYHKSSDKFITFIVHNTFSEQGFNVEDVLHLRTKKD